MLDWPQETWVQVVTAVYQLREHRRVFSADGEGLFLRLGDKNCQ